VTQSQTRLAAGTAVDEAVPQLDGAERPGRRLIWIAILVQLFFVYVGKSGTGALATVDLGPVKVQLVPVFLVLATVAVVVTRFRIRTKACAAQAALTVMISIFLAFPITRLTSIPKVLLIIAIGAPLLMALCGLLGGKGNRFAFGTTAVAILFAVVSFATLVSGDKGGSVRLLLILGATLPVFLLSTQIGSEGAHRITDVIVAIAVLQSVIAVVEPFAFPQHLFGPAQHDSDGNVVPLLNEFFGHGIQRSQGTLGHPLPLGLLMVLALALVLRMWLGREVTRWAVVALLLGGLIFAGNRNSLLLAIALILFFPPKRMTPGRFVAAVILAGITFVLAIYSGVLSSSALDGFAASGSYGHRIAAYQAFGQLLTKQHLFQIFIGNGSASLGRLFAGGLLQTDGFNVVDNQYLLTLAQGGLISLAALVFLCLRALTTADRFLRAAVGSVVVSGLIFDWMSWTSTASLCFFVLGVALTVPRGARTEDRDLEDQNAATGPCR